jgi:hypothetical protein
MLFFGRERESETVAANLMARPLTVLFGASGVGKSSLVRAGLARHLQRFAQLGDDEGTVGVAICSSWHDDPVEALIRAIVDAVDGGDPVPRGDDLVATLGAASANWRELFVVLDQFEEYFVYHDPHDDRALAAALRSAIADQSLPVSFLISIREDALAKLDRLREIPRLFDHRLQVQHLGRAEAREAIERPLEVFNSTVVDDPVTIEPELVEHVLDEVTVGRLSLGVVGTPAESRIDASFLQLVMYRLWDEARADGSRVLRLATLERLGGAEGIVNTALVQALESISEVEREVAAAVFRFLVTPSGTRIAMTATDLAELASQPVEDVLRTVDKLTGERILRAVVDATGDSEPRFEITNDLLAAAVVDWSAPRREGVRVAEAREVRRLRRLVKALAATSVILGVAVVLLAIRAFT